MEYPHRPYLRFLLSRRMTAFEILADCEARLLVPPAEPDLQAMARELGPAPPSWAGRVENANVAFRRWLRDRRLLDMWRGGPVQEKATALLYADELRRAVEQLLLVHGDPEKVNQLLSQKYGERVAPSAEVVARFRDCFWDVGSMTKHGLFEFLKVLQQDKERAPAVRGEVATVYGQLGLRQRVEADELYDNIIALANQQVQAARQAGGLLSGQALIGLSTIARQAIDAAKERAELHTIGGQAAEDVRQKALAFKLRTIEAQPILSIEELDQPFAEPDQEHDEDAAPSNVRKFLHPVPR